MLLLGAALVLSRASDRRDLPPHLTAHHENMLAFHLRGDAALPPGRWLFFGDSIVQGLPVGALGVPAVNYGIGNDDAIGVAARLPSYDSVATAAAVVLGVGVNDLTRTEGVGPLAGYRALLETIPPGPRVVCLGPLPIDERVDRPHRPGRTNAAIRALGEGIEAACRERGHDFVPAPPELADPGGNLRADLHVGDGVHPGPAGYAAWLAGLGPALDALASAPPSRASTRRATTP